MTNNTDTTAASGAASQPSAFRTDACEEAFVRDFCPYSGSPDPLVVWRAAWQAALAARAAQEAEPAQVLCWVHEDELPESMPDAAYSALFPSSKVDVVRLFPIFAPSGPRPQEAEPALGDPEVDELARIAFETATAYGVGFEDFRHLAREIRRRCAAPRPQADAGAVPVPEGWRLMPAKATQEILDAIRRVVDLETSDPEDHRYDDGTSTADALYEALIAAAPQAPAAPDMESVLIDGVAYQTPAPVAAELLRLHLEAMEAPAAGAAPTDAAHKAAVDHAHEILGRQLYHRDGDYFVNVNRSGAEAMHVRTVATIVHAALISAAAPAQEAEDAYSHADVSQAHAEGYKLGLAQAAPLTQAARDVLAERRRQVEAEGWTPEHDDQYPPGTMARAAGCYATINTYPTPTMWPWAPEWWKPRDDRSNYVRASALLLAELERHDRAAARARQEGGA